MKITLEQKKKADSLRWWHRIRLSDDYTTPGECPHGSDDELERRWGFPVSFTGCSVLDIGAWDGLFSFAAEKRGAKFVQAIDKYQNPQSPHDENAPFKFAKEILNSEVKFDRMSLEHWHSWCTNYEGREKSYDVILYFGVLYHVVNPLTHVEMLMDLVAPEGTILVETATSQSKDSVLEYRPNKTDKNIFYPSHKWIEDAFLENGAKSVELVYSDPHRATFRVNT